VSIFSKPSGLPQDSNFEDKMSDKPKVRDSGVETLLIHKSRLVPSKNQPRKYFAPDMIDERRRQMESDGQESPITVYPPIPGEDGEDVWPIHDGECRWRAVMQSEDEKLEYLRAELYQGDTENTFRKLLSQLMHNDEGSAPLTNVEKAMAYQKLVEEMTKQGSRSPIIDVAAKLGKAVSHVSELLKISEMSAEMIDFSLEQGITDTRVLSGMMRIHKKGGEERSRQLIEELSQSTENTQPLRDIIKKHAQQIKNKKPVKKEGKKKEKPIRLITASTVKLKEKGNGQKVLAIETTREIININITDEHLVELQ
jgi:ParB/RepB/Spo0J family partition protein